MPRRINPLKSFTTNDTDLAVQVRKSQYNIAEQLRKPTANGRLRANMPNGEREGDQNTQVTPNGTFVLSVSDPKGSPMQLQLAPDTSSNLGFKTGAAAPALTDYPNDGDNGWFLNTGIVPNQLWYVRNYQGTLVYLNFVAISGTITAAQHGDLSGAGGTMHNFNQLAGELTDAQHGDRGRATGGNPMHTNATTTEAGFLSTAFFDLLDGATSAATANALVRRGAAGAANFAGTLGVVDVDASGHYEVDGTQVVTNQQTGWSAWTGTVSRASHATYTAATAGVAYDQTQAQNAFDALQHVSRAVAALLQNLATHGLIDS